ncbi:Acg family FMN-binding oxidoreductase [Nocardiopsis suaedae]|uniref:Nitroreductase n=1 Tax=Nocardiopsis suaedae TaxID=3018444 RepID=A0ABT4TKT2_9ACTN|nr:hypothetical protein [Nocardiopsis suaedae]MDA2804995.1 hypothetical protein [Nocardiopsis suaedae]
MTPQAPSTRPNPPSEASALDAAVRAADQAPSVYGTRPWTVRRVDGRITLGTDPDRRLAVSDPDARQQVVSCGAALFTAVAALRAHGVRPSVRELPDPDRPGLLAEVRAAGTVEPTAEDRMLYESVGLRRTHRGPFPADVDDVRTVRALVAAAAAEGAVLRPLGDERLTRSLAGLVTAAEFLHRCERDTGDELARWVRAPDAADPDGVHAEDFPPPGRVADALFPDRDYGRGRVRGLLDPHGDVAGTAALLTTVGDGRADRLAAGRALQRVLLTATAGGVSSAFHTQPLEEPHLRAFIGARMCDGAYPQMVLRLGRRREARPHRLFASVQEGG